MVHTSVIKLKLRAFAFYDETVVRIVRSYDKTLPNSVRLGDDIVGDNRTVPLVAAGQALYIRLCIRLAEIPGM